MRADDAGNDEDEAEEAEAVEGGEGAVGIDAVHEAESGQGVEAEGEQGCEVAEGELQLEDGVNGHRDSFFTV